jgi:DNA polymerase
MDFVAAFQALALQIEFGADEAIAATALDRLAAPPPAASTPVVPTAAPFAAAAAQVRSTPRQNAEHAAATASSLPALSQAIAGFEACRLRDTATNPVFASGDASAGLLLLGEAPGTDEDRSGIAFSGPEGMLLDQMLGSIGLTRDAVLLSHLLPWRPPGNQPPSAADIDCCLPFLLRLIFLARIRRVVAFGALPAKALLGGAARPGGKPAWKPVSPVGADPVTFNLLPLPSLAAVARTPERKREAWLGLRLLRRELDRS